MWIFVLNLMINYIMSKINYTVLLFAFCVCILAGCNTEPDVLDDRQIWISFSIYPLSSSLTKSGDNQEETFIKNLIIYGVDGWDNVVQTITPGLPEPPLTNIPVSVLKKVKSLYAIANPSPGIKSENPLTVGDLLKLTVDLSDPPHSPFLMSGNGDIDGDKASIKLSRAVAKIEFIGKNDFQIDLVTVTDTPDEGYIFKRGTPGSSALVPYPAVTDPILYVAENNTINPTVFEVTGQFNGEQKIIKFSLSKNEQPIDIVCNTYYQVNIIPITGSDYTITLIRPESGWNDVITDIQVISKPKPPDLYKDGIKILAIGNSYSNNAMCYMFDLLVQLGVNQSNIKLVSAYIGGGSLNMHAISAKDNTLSYDRYQFFAKGGYSNRGNNTYKLEELIKEDKWDIITLQQASDNSGRHLTYNEDLDYLISYVHTNLNDSNNPNNNPNYKLGWHMTWAYTSPAINDASYYGYNQIRMYDSICQVVQRKIVRNDAFDFVIPVGTAIQNARAPGLFNDILNRIDGSHLSNTGGYIAAAMWVKKITGYDIANVQVPYTASSSVIFAGSPEFTVDATARAKVVQAVNAAASSPFAITPP